MAGRVLLKGPKGLEVTRPSLERLWAIYRSEGVLEGLSRACGAMLLYLIIYGSHLYNQYMYFKTYVCITYLR